MLGQEEDEERGHVLLGYAVGIVEEVQVVFNISLLMAYHCQSEDALDAVLVDSHYPSEAGLS